jgi:hypothetical protein
MKLAVGLRAQDQNSSFSPNCMTRGPGKVPAEKIFPELGFGSPPSRVSAITVVAPPPCCGYSRPKSRLTWLNALNRSTRSWSLLALVTLKDFRMPISQVQRPGPNHMLRSELPYCQG